MASHLARCYLWKMVNLLMDLFYLLLGNIFNIVIALLGLRLLVKVLTIPKTYLMPTIAILCVIGSYALRNNFFDVYVMFGLGYSVLPCAYWICLSFRSC